MSMPFPGMDPYLEHPDLWPGFHHDSISRLKAQLQRQITPRYVARIEHRIYMEGTGEQRVPDIEVSKADPNSGGLATLSAGDTPLVLELPEVEVHEGYIEIIDRYRKFEIVTVIEVVSPSNKRSGPGRAAYLKKQREVLATECHLLEIDLLRRGEHVMSVPEAELTPWRPFDYLICVNRWPKRNRFELYRRPLHDRLPQIRVPLTDPDPDVVLDLQPALEKVYEEAAYPLLVRYDEPCQPSLSAEDQQWANECLRAYQIANPQLFPVAANGS